MSIRTEDADRIIAIGSDRMMAGVAKARHDVLKRHLKPHHCAIGSINSPMQCMMKEICAQCLQVHRDPANGGTVVFSCFNQDQPLDAVDFGSLEERLKQNALQEKLTAQWVLRCRNRSAPRCRPAGHVRAGRRRMGGKPRRTGARLQKILTISRRADSGAC